MKEFDSIRIVDKGGDSLSFEMTGNVAGSPYDTIVFLLRATSGLIAASAKDSADPQKVADVFAKLFAKRIAQDIQDERDRRAESAEAVVERFGFQVREISESVKAPLVNDAEQEQEEAQGAAHKPAKKGGLRRMILLFIGGLVVGALAGIFALGLISSGHCAECRAYYDRQMEAMRRRENRWR